MIRDCPGAVFSGEHTDISSGLNREDVELTMANHTTTDIRNIALVGHAGCGKTTLAERILEKVGLIGRMGTIKDRNTVCDYEPEEKEHQHSLSNALVHFEHKGASVNLIDTPGYPDFIGNAFSPLSAVEAALIVIDAGRGIENLTRRVFKLATDEQIPRAIVINKIDHGTGELAALVETIRETFGKECLPINLPVGGGSGVVRCFRAGQGETDFSSVEEAHSALVDQVVEVDDALMEKYLETGSVTPEQLAGTFAKALNTGHLVPIFFASGETGVGVDELLAVIEEFFPNPGNGVRRTFFVQESGKGEETLWQPEPDASKPLVAHVFRVTADPFVGKLAVFRVHQGTIKAGDSVHVGDGRKPVRIAHLYQIQGKDTKEIHEAGPGDLVGIAKIEEVAYNHVLHNGLPFESIRVKPIALPRPMFGLAVSAAKRGEEGKISQALVKLTEEDPTLELIRDATTHQMVLRGIGELHLRVMMEKLKNRFHLDVVTAPPKIAYKETIAGKAEGHHRHKKQTGGAGQFGEVFLRVEPMTDGESTYEFVDDTFGGSVPKQFMPAIEKGVKQVLETGCIAGYPMQGIRVSVYDGKYHPVDSKEVAFVTAGKRAFIDAVSKARPVLLEPYVQMEITVPSEYMGDVNGDMAGRRGRVQGTDMLPGGQAVISAVAPLSEVMTYASSLKAMTQGTGSYTMEYSHDEQAPSNVQAEVVAQYKPHAEED